mgnify:CR=1 FL=1
MKKPIYIVLALLSAVVWCSCEDYETYAEQKEKEKNHIYGFIDEQGIKVIDMETFEANGQVTDTAKNEFVLFEDKGVYMQIVRKGVGEPMTDGDREEILSRYIECNIADRDTISGNLYASTPDEFTCERDADTFSASFTRGYMYAIYGSAVPKGWLVPLSYVSLSRIPDAEGFQGAKVKLIIPHGQGTSNAAQYVYPTYYEITYLKKP